MTSKLEIVQH
jgi:HD-GYP domain-containing protein (c-di-GMP phosphodiesterase class II)